MKTINLSISSNSIIRKQTQKVFDFFFLISSEQWNVNAQIERELDLNILKFNNIISIVEFASCYAYFPKSIANLIPLFSLKI